MEGPESWPSVHRAAKWRDTQTLSHGDSKRFPATDEAILFEGLLEARAEAIAGGGSVEFEGHFKSLPGSTRGQERRIRKAHGAFRLTIPASHVQPGCRGRLGLESESAGHEPDQRLGIPGNADERNAAQLVLSVEVVRE